MVPLLRIPGEAPGQGQIVLHNTGACIYCLRSYISISLCLKQSHTLSLRCTTGKEYFNVAAGLQLLCHVARRIDKLHKAGFAHRDLKPGNIMMLPHRMCWVLIDFGISAPIGKDVPLQFTLHYAAPETAAEFCAGTWTVTATAEVDAWALGVIAYEVLLGKQPFALKSETEVCSNAWFKYLLF